MWYVELKICMRDKQHRYYKHTKYRQNLRGSLQFFGDWAYTMAIRDFPDIRALYIPTPLGHIYQANHGITAKCCVRVAKLVYYQHSNV